MKKKLKPVIFVQGEKDFYRQNNYAQNLLLKALSQGVTSPQELKRLSGLKTVANVYRTLDKMAIRKEYHDALSRAGISLDYIVNGIKNVCTDAKSEATKLKGLHILLRSLGLDVYDKQEMSGQNWEEVVMKSMEQKQDKDSVKKLIGECQEEVQKESALKSQSEVKEVKPAYDVIIPKAPAKEIRSREYEQDLGAQLYEQ